MPERRPKPDLDAKFSLHPLTAEEVLTRLLGTDATHQDGEDEEPNVQEDRDS